MIEYHSNVHTLTPDRLQGFFVGWKAPLTPEAHLKLLRGSTHAVVAVDTQTDRVVGFVTALSDGLNSSFIPLLEVLPAYQGRGIGTRLMEEILGKLEGITNVDLMCDPEMRPFYERFGMMASSGMVLRKYLRHQE